jgi:hypothetical protein
LDSRADQPPAASGPGRRVWRFATDGCVQIVVLGALWLVLLGTEIANDHWKFLPASVAGPIAIAVVVPIFLIGPAVVFWRGGKGGIVGAVLRWLTWAVAITVIVIIPAGIAYAGVAWALSIRGDGFPWSVLAFLVVPLCLVVMFFFFGPVRVILFPWHPNDYRARAGYLAPWHRWTARRVRR